MLSSQSLANLLATNMLASRLIPGSGFEVGAPEEGEVDELIGAMSKQRGLNLSEVKRHYVTRRIRREVEEIDSFLSRLLLSGEIGAKLSKFQTLQDSL